MLLWLVNSYIPMDRKIKNIMNGVVVVFLVLWLLDVFGVLAAVDIWIPQEAIAHHECDKT